MGPDFSQYSNEFLIKEYIDTKKIWNLSKFNSRTSLMTTQSRMNFLKAEIIRRGLDEKEKIPAKES